jgi:hypothetical protein
VRMLWQSRCSGQNTVRAVSAPMPKRAIPMRLWKVVGRTMIDWFGWVWITVALAALIIAIIGATR